MTPHDIRIMNGGNVTVIKKLPLVEVARLDECEECEKTFLREGIIVVNKKYSGFGTNIPAQQEGIVYIVSQFVAQAFPYRTDLLFPDTGPGSAIRNEEGTIIAVRRLACLENAFRDLVMENALGDA